MFINPIVLSLIVFGIILFLPTSLFLLLCSRSQYSEKNNGKRLRSFTSYAALIFFLPFLLFFLILGGAYIEFYKINPDFSLTPESSFTAITFLTAFVTGSGLVALINFVNKILDINETRRKEKREYYQALEQEAREFLAFNCKWQAKLQLLTDDLKSGASSSEIITNKQVISIDLSGESFIQEILKYELINDPEIIKIIARIFSNSKKGFLLTKEDDKVIERLIELLRKTYEKVDGALLQAKHYVKNDDYDKAIQQIESEYKKTVAGLFGSKDIPSKILPPSTNS